MKCSVMNDKEEAHREAGGGLPKKENEGQFEGGLLACQRAVEGGEVNGFAFGSRPIKINCL